MTTILLTQNKITLVDKEVYGLLSSYKWYYDKPNNCASRRDMNTKKIVKMHRVIMDCPEGLEVDHINGNSLDNRKINLRICTHAQNSKNTKIQSNNTSGHKGVTFDSRARKWKARINVDGKQIHLGFYDNAAQAGYAYNKAAEKYFGEFERNITLKTILINYGMEILEIASSDPTNRAIAIEDLINKYLIEFKERIIG